MKVNLSYLREWSDGDKGKVLEMINIFKSQIEEFAHDMDEYLEKKDYIALGKLAHKAKSSISIMGLDELSKDMKELENLTKSGKEEDKYSILVNKFKQETAIAVKELDDVLQNSDSFL